MFFPRKTRMIMDRNHKRRDGAGHEGLCGHGYWRHQGGLGRFWRGQDTAGENQVPLGRQPLRGGVLPAGGSPAAGPVGAARPAGGGPGGHWRGPALHGALSRGGGGPLRHAARPQRLWSKGLPGGAVPRGAGGRGQRRPLRGFGGIPPRRREGPPAHALLPGEHRPFLGHHHRRRAVPGQQRLCRGERPHHPHPGAGHRLRLRQPGVRAVLRLWGDDRAAHPPVD